MHGPLANGSRPLPGLAFIFALRELRGGLSGFYIFLACIALGVGAITGVNAVAASITTAIAERGQAILGGDLALSIVQRELPEEVVGFVSDRGAVSRTVTLRAMARLPDGSDQTLVELKAIDEAYPLYGQVTSGGAAAPVNEMTAQEAWVAPLLMERLSLSAGERIAIGRTEFTIAGTIGEEPDRLSEGIGFGPRVMVSHDGLARAGLIQPGSLYRTNWSLRLSEPRQENLARTIEEIRQKFPGAPFRLRSRENAAPSLSRNIERFSQFLTLVGLAALVVGGVGVANSVRAYLDMKRDVIATLKSLGASGGFIFNVYLVQIMLLGAAGVVCGLALGMAAPPVARVVLEGVVPISGATVSGFGITPVLLGSTYGLLTAFIFAVWPLGRAREVRAASLFRAAGFEGGGLPRPIYLFMLCCGLAVLAWLAIASSGNRQVASIFLISVAGSFILLRAVALIIQWVAARVPALPMPGLRLAVANIHRPGSATPSVVLSLGLGLALITALTLIDGSLRQQITANIPKQAPDFFFVDIQSGQIGAFRDKLNSLAPGGGLQSVPMLRGRITELKGIAAEDYETEQGQWVLRGDRGITYAADIPANASISKGEWWPPEYDGEPLLSFTAEEADELGLGVGDVIKVNVLGRIIEARIANLRHVEWETLAINFVMVFSPNTFAGAPHAWLATLTLPDDGATRDMLEARDGTILRDITRTFPTVTSVRVRDAIDTINSLIGQLSTAVRAASAVALIASFLVLAGALAAGNRVRAHDAVVMKTLGARRMFLIRSMVAEYALLGAATALFGLLAGSIAAWHVVTQIMEFTAVFQPGAAIAVVAAALAVTILLGLAGTWRILGRKPGPALREP